MRRAATSPNQLAVIGICALLLSACSKEPPPRTVVEFVDNPRLLEATVVRCAQNRNELKYTQECLNARDAVERIAATEEAARRSELDAQSERKREALRRAQQAAAEARQRAAEAERLRAEAEYLGQFEDSGQTVDTYSEGIEPGATPETGELEEPGEELAADELPPAEPVVTEDPPEEAGSLEAVRNELQRRQQSDGQ